MSPCQAIDSTKAKQIPCLDDGTMHVVAGQLTSAKEVLCDFHAHLLRMDGYEVKEVSAA